MIPTKPYMVRAIHEWCLDNGFTPHLLVAVDAQTRVPTAYVKNGEIVLNINDSAIKDLHIDNEAIVFTARFNGVAQHIHVPMRAVKGIFARENSQGMFFEVASHGDGLSNSDDEGKHDAGARNGKPTLTVVK